MSIRPCILLTVIFCLPISTAFSFEEVEEKKEAATEVKLDPTEYLPGPAGIPIKVPRKVERQLKKHRALQAKQLGGNEDFYYVIGLLETTYQPRSASIADLGRGLAAILDVLMLPVTIPAGEPGILTRDMSPPPPDWVRSDLASVRRVKGKEAAIDLVYGFTTERVLDPPDPQVLHRQRTWFLLTKTRKEEEAKAVEEGAIKSVQGKLPRFDNDDARFAEQLKQMEEFSKNVEPEVEKLRAEVEKVLVDVNKLKDDESFKRLLELNQALRTAIEK